MKWLYEGEIELDYRIVKINAFVESKSKYYELPTLSEADQEILQKIRDRTVLRYQLLFGGNDDLKEFVEAHNGKELTTDQILTISNEEPSSYMYNGSALAKPASQGNTAGYLVQYEDGHKRWLDKTTFNTFFKKLKRSK
jgi:hypothetical protein